MSYSKAIEAARVKARDILRTQMAGRIMGRIEGAKQDYLSALKHYVNVLASNARAATKETEEANEVKQKRDDFAQALGSATLTDDERGMVTEAIEKQQAENDKRSADDAEMAAKERDARAKAAQDAIADAKATYEHHQDNLKKLESGEMKVNKEDLDALTQELVRADKSVPEGTQEVAEPLG